MQTYNKLQSRLFEPCMLGLGSTAIAADVNHVLKCYTTL